MIYLKQTTKISDANNNYQVHFSRGWKIISANLFRRMFVWVSSIKMLQYDRIDISEGIDLKKQTHQKSVKFAIIGTLKMLVLNMNHIFVMVVMVYYKKLLVLIILLLFMLKGVLTEFTFGIWVKMMQLT